MKGDSDFIVRVGAEDVGSKAPSEGDSKLEINVVFTSFPNTMAALRTACELARQLEARIRLLVVQTVPLSWSLECPPVSLKFIKERCRKMALQCVEVGEVKIDVYLCWEKMQALRQALRPRSLVAVGGRRRWWKTREQKLTRTLQAEGHRVVFADTRDVYGSAELKRGRRE
jgi:hypothetical protein